MLRTAPEQCRNHINTKGLPNKATLNEQVSSLLKRIDRLTNGEERHYSRHQPTIHWRHSRTDRSSVTGAFPQSRSGLHACHALARSSTESSDFFNNHAHIINNYYYHTITITPEWTITKRVKGKLEGATINSSIWSLQPLACESAAYPPEYCKKKKLITTKQRICVHIHVLFTVTVHHHSPQYMYDGWRAIVLTECGASTHLIECERLILGNVSSILWIEKR